MTIKHWPPNERPRERLLQHGENQLTDAELLAIFMVKGTKGYTAIDLARQALAQAGSLTKLLNYNQPELCQQTGFGHVSYCQLQAALELGQRYYRQILHDNNVLSTPEATQRFIQHKLQHQQREVFACLLLDIKCRLIHYQELFYGTINRSQVHLREIIKLALAHNASGLIITHNHPSGDPLPSRHDKAITLQLKDALDYVDIHLWDHIIVGHQHCYSFCEHGEI